MSRTYRDLPWWPWSPMPVRRPRRLVKVFYSFDFDRDSWRAMQLKDAGVVESHDIVEAQEWESVKAAGRESIQRWIDSRMAESDAAVVLIGARTARRFWVQYEISHARESGVPLLGVFVDSLLDEKGHTDRQGPDPFRTVLGAGHGVPIHNQAGTRTCDEIVENLPAWIREARHVAPRAMIPTLASRIASPGR